MRFQFFVCLLLVTFVCAQNTPPASAPPAQAPPAGGSKAASAPEKAPDAQAAEPQVGANDPVITIKGVCADASLQGDACKTVVTKSQFDKIVDTIQPGMAPPMRRQLAMRYVGALAMSMEAEKRGLEKQPDFDSKMQMARIQVLAQQLRASIQADSNNVSDQDIQDYYQKNAQNYEQATLIKIFVPRTRREATPATTAAKPGAKSAASTSTAAAKPAAKKLSPEEEEKANQEAMTKEAKLLRERLVKGEDPDTLEKAAFTAGGILGTPPPTKMDNVRRISLQANQQSVMDLKPGEVSEVISDASGHFIYKMVSKETLSVDKVKTEIHNQLSAQHYREAMQKYQGVPDLNDAYFGPSRSPAMPPRGGPAGRPGAPAKDNDPD